MRLSFYRKRIEAVMLSKIPCQKGERLLPWAYISSRKEKGAFEYVYRVPIGRSAGDLERQVDALFAACGSMVEIEDFAGACLVRVLPTDFPPSIPYNVDYLELTKGKEILIGFDRQGEPIKHSLRVPHLMIAGKSGYGKTDLVRWILFQLIHKFTPEQVELWIIDMKGFSFIPFKNVPHVTRIVRDLPGASQLLADAVKIMEKRSKEVWNAADRKKATNYKTIFVLIDEAFHIAPKVIANKERRKIAALCDEAAAKISGTGREAGVGLLYCTQRPDADVINPLVKANMDAKICFKTETASNSVIVLDREGAEKLPQGKPGRVYFSRDGLIECQVPYIGDDDAWEELLKPYQRKEEGDEQEGFDLDTSEGAPPLLDGTSGEILFNEWEPVKASKRDFDHVTGGKMDRGKAAGNRKDEIVAAKLDWSEAFRNH